MYAHWYTVITGRHCSLSSGTHSPAVLTTQQYSLTYSLHSVTECSPFMVEERCEYSFLP